MASTQTPYSVYIIHEATPTEEPHSANTHFDVTTFEGEYFPVLKNFLLYSFTLEFAFLIAGLLFSFGVIYLYVKNYLPEKEKIMPSVRLERYMLSKHDGQHPKYELPFDPDWEVPKESLIMGRVLGEGTYGKVLQAEARRSFQQRNVTTVAVKMLKDHHTDDNLVQFVTEMELMKLLGKHSNVINLLGCCTQELPMLVIIELAPYGNVRDFLRKHRSCLRIRKECNCLTERDLVWFGYQVAKGMDYLASRKYIHGDLAAHNVLVCDDYMLKISHFGLARRLQQKDYYRKKISGLLPIKWMSPESLFDNIYTTKSDVLLISSERRKVPAEELEVQRKEFPQNTDNLCTH